MKAEQLIAMLGEDQHDGKEYEGIPIWRVCHEWTCTRLRELELAIHQTECLKEAWTEEALSSTDTVKYCSDGHSIFVPDLPAYQQQSDEPSCPTCSVRAEAEAATWEAAARLVEQTFGAPTGQRTYVWNQEQTQRIAEMLRVQRAAPEHAD